MLGLPLLLLMLYYYCGLVVALGESVVAWGFWLVVEPEVEVLTLFEGPPLAC